MSYQIKIMILNLLYIFSIFIVYFKYFKKNILIREKVYLIMIFMLFLSPYNIMIKKIHDYNLIYIFNFLWKYKLVSSLSILDIIFFIFFVYNIFSIKNTILKNKLVRYIVMRDLFYIVLGVLSYIISESYFLDNGKNMIIKLRAIPYFYLSYYLTFKYFKIKPIIFYNNYKILIFYSLISLSLFSRNEVWVRHGFRVTLIAQEWATGVWLFTTLYLFFKVLNTNREKINFFITFFILFINLYKTNLIFLIFTIYYVLFIKLKNTKKIDMLKKIIIFLIIILLGFNLLKIKSIKSIKTRVIQLEEYMLTLKNNGFHTYFIGLGIGAPYINTQKNKDDLGEIKAIDINKSKKYKYSLQTPILSNHKDVGIVGIFILLIINIKIFGQIKNKYKTNKNYKNSEYEAAMTFILFNCLILQISSIFATLPIALFNGFVLGRYQKIELLEKIKKG